MNVSESYFHVGSSHRFNLGLAGRSHPADPIIMNASFFFSRLELDLNCSARGLDLRWVIALRRWGERDHLEDRTESETCVSQSKAKHGRISWRPE